MRAIVIGAGMVGLATAWRLHREGHDVTVVDPAPASGATRAAGGMLTPVGEAYHGEDDLTALQLASARRYPAFVEDVAAHLPADTHTGFLTSGTLIVGSDAADRGHLADLHDLCVRLGLRTEAVTTREACRLEPLLSPRLTCAFLAPDDHQVDPRLLAAALLAVLRGQGVEIREEAATGVVAAETPRVDLASGDVLAGDVVVVASGLGAADLTRDLGGGHGLDLDHVLRPVHGEVLRLTAPPHLAPLMTRTVRGLVEGRPVYLIPRGDGRVLLGASSREDDERGVLAGGVHDLLVDAVRLVPAVREFAVEEVLARARPGTPDNAPVIGTIAPGVVVATGLFRHGILLSPLVADLVAAHVRGLAGTPDPGDADLLTLADCAAAHRFSRTTAGKDTP